MRAFVLWWFRQWAAGCGRLSVNQHLIGSTRLPVRSVVRIDYRWKFSATVSNLLTGDLAGRWIKPGTDDDERTCRCLENLLRGERKDRIRPALTTELLIKPSSIRSIPFTSPQLCSTRHKLSGKRLGIPDRGEKQVTH
jgi:hypothetical protein